MFYNHMIFCKSNEMLKKYDAYDGKNTITEVKNIDSNYNITCNKQNVSKEKMIRKKFGR